jgi:hypothetical protein
VVPFRKLGALRYEFWFWTLATVNLALILGVLALHSVVEKENGLGRRFPRVETMDPSGHRVVLNHEDSCWAIRFTSSQCPACQQDLARNWPRLRQVLIGRGCRIYYVQPSILAPSAPDNAGSGSEMGLWAVSPSFASDSGLVATPTTVLLDSRAIVVWRHVGVLSDSDVTAATHSIPARDPFRPRGVGP